MVFKEGIISVYNDQLESTLSVDLNLSAINPQNQVINVQHIRSKNDLLMYVVTGGINLKHSLHIIKYSKETKDTKQSLKKISTLHLNERQASYVTACSIDYESNVYVALWNDGYMEYYHLENDPVVSGQNSWTVTNTQQLSVFKTEAPKKTKQRRRSSTSSSPTATISSVFIKPGYVAFAGDNTSQSEPLLTIWDVNFGLVTTSEILNLTELLSNEKNMIELSSAKAEVNGAIKGAKIKQSSVSRDGSYIFLNFGFAVIVKPIVLETSSLASIIGAYDKTKPFIEAKDQEVEEFGYGNLVGKIKPITSSKSKKKVSSRYATPNEEVWKKVVGEDDGKELDLINSMVDATKTPDYTSFMEVYEEYMSITRAKSREGIFSLFPQYLADEESFEYVQYIHGSKKGIDRKWKNLKEYSEKQNRSIQKELLQDDIQSREVDHSYLFVERVANRCLEEDFLWVPLRHIIESGMLSVHAIPNLFDKVIEKERLDILVALLLHVQDVTEHDVVKSLSYILSLDITNLQVFLSEFSSGSDSIMEIEESSPIEQGSIVDSFIDIVVSIPANEAFLRKHIKSLKNAEVTILLQYFSSFFHNSLDNKVASKIRAPSPQQVITWANLVIESHLLKLVLSSESLALVTKIHAYVQDNIKLQETMEGLRSSMAYYYDHDPAPKDELSDYSIEVLRI